MAKYTPLQEKAYEFLKNKITRGELEHGKFYSETKMAAEIGISRTPFKDALVRLSQDRYIDIVPSRGFCLHTLSLQDIINTYQSRTAVEGFCAFSLHTKRKEKEAAAVIEALFRDNEVAWVYVYEKPVEADTLVLQASEVAAVRWFDMAEVRREIEHTRERFCVPKASLDLLARWLRER